MSSETATTEAEPLLSWKTSKPPCVPAALHVLLLLERALERRSCRVTSAKPSTGGSEPSAGTSSTPIATSVPSQERTCASVGPPSVAWFAALSNSATSFGQLGKRAPSASRRFQAVGLLVDVGVGERDRRGREGLRGAAVGAGGARGGAGLARAAAAGEHDAHQDERGERGQGGGGRRRCVECVMTALYDRRRIARRRREAVSMPNIFEPDFNQRREHPGFRALRARLGWELATERLGASIWEIEPGEAAYPYHYHLAEEEFLVVLLGRPSVRTDGEWRELEPGDVLVVPARPRGRATRSRTGAT